MQGGSIRRILWRHFRGDLPDRPLGSEEPWAYGTVLRPKVCSGEWGVEMDRDRARQCPPAPDNSRAKL